MLPSRVNDLTVDSSSERSVSRPRRLRARLSSSTVMMPSLFLSNRSNMRRRRRVFRLSERRRKDELLRLRLRGVLACPCPAFSMASVEQGMQQPRNGEMGGAKRE